MAVVSCLVMEKIILTPSQIGILIQTSLDVLRPVRCNHHFLVCFLIFDPDSPTYAKSKRVGYRVSYLVGSLASAFKTTFGPYQDHIKEGMGESCSH